MQKVNATRSQSDALTFGIDYKISDNLIIHQPTVSEIRDIGIEEFVRAMMSFASRPYDHMVMLYDMGFDFRKIDEFAYFVEIILPNIDTKYLDIVIKGVPLKDYIYTIDKNKNPILYHSPTGSVIDKATYFTMVEFIRSMVFLPQQTKYQIGNDITYEFIIRRERRRIKKLSKQPVKEYTLFNDMISYLIWCSNGNYSFDTIQQLTLYQIYEGVKRSQADKKFAYISSGIYAGTVDGSKINFEDIDPLRHFNNTERKDSND